MGIYSLCTLAFDLHMLVDEFQIYKNNLVPFYAILINDSPEVEFVSVFANTQFA